MQAIWNRTPVDFQREAVPRLLMMRCVPNTPQALLLVQGTGAGKSAVAQTVGIVDCGVTLVIEETLALAADQQSKVKSASNANGPVLAYLLDSIKKTNLIKKLEDKLSGMKSGTNASVFLYSSPECLMKEPWKSLLIKLINNGVLKLVCVDEIHLFVMFGITFRKSFVNLKDTFFKYLIDKSKTTSSSSHAIHLKVPLLLMTATFNNRLLGIMEKMIGIKVLRENYLWSGRKKIAQRNIRINVEFTLQSTRVIKRVLKSTLSDNLNKKCIVYTNTVSCLDQLKIDVEHWLDSSDGIKGDALIIHGDMKAEVKFVSAQMFTKNTENAKDLVNTNSFYPRILMATAGSIGTGHDSGDVYCVVKIGFSTSILEMVQEMGRCGRGRQNGWHLRI